MKVPIHQAATERIMMGGVPRKIAILGGTIGAALFFGMHNFYIVPVMGLVYLCLYVLYKIDPYFMEIISRHIKEDDYLSP